MGDVIPFDFKGRPVRVVTGAGGEPWFVAADVAAVLEYRMASDMTRALDDEERGTQIVRTPSGDQEMTVINESGLYSAILRSRKPEAKAFKKWVTSEVLPSIRKTGGYQAPGAVPPVPIGPKQIVIAVKLCANLERIGKMFGLKGNQLHLSANRATETVTGVNLLQVLGTSALVAEEQVAQHFTATDLGQRLGISGRAFNKLLVEKGLQVEVRDAKGAIHWKPTRRGEAFAVLVDTNKKHSDGAPVQQLRWLDSVMREVGETKSDGAA